LHTLSRATCVVYSWLVSHHHPLFWVTSRIKKEKERKIQPCHNFRPANVLGLNGFNGLDFQVGALWMGGNVLIYLADRVGLGLIENWVGWVGIGFFFLGVSGLSPWVDVELLIYHSIHIY
jgi:hypothetical protein